MDPNETLRIALALAESIIETIDASADEDTGDLPAPVADDIAEQANELAEAVCNLNDWISRGGFLPTAWKGGRR